MAAAVNAPVSVMETAGEGGAWGIALLAGYMCWKEEGESLSDYLKHKVFAGQSRYTITPDESDVAGFEAFLKRYQAGLPVEQAAVQALKR